MAPIAATITPTVERPVRLPWSSIGWLYFIQGANLLLPMLSLPYLMRVLGPGAWGRVAFAQSFALVLGLFVEYGFNYSATRAVAQARGDEGRQRAVAGEILSAQVVLLGITIAVAFLLRPWLPVVGGDLALFWMAVAWMVPQAAGLQWYFQGIEQMPLYSALTAASRAAGVAGVFAFVKEPADATLALGVQAAAGLVLTAAVWWHVSRQADGFSLVPATVGRALAAGRGLFIYRGGVYLYAVANTMALGFFGPEAQLGAYALAERLAKAVAGFLDPISLAVLPRLIRRPQLRRRSALLLVGAGLGLGAGLWMTAPWIVRLVAGRDWREAVDTLRVLAWFPPGAALCQAFGVHRFVPGGRDWHLAGIVGIAAVVHAAMIVALSRLVAPGQAHGWLAWSAVATQFLQLFAFVAAARSNAAEDR